MLTPLVTLVIRMESCQAHRQCTIRLQAGEKLEGRVSAQLAEIGKKPALVRAFFKHPSVSYISDL